MFKKELPISALTLSLEVWIGKNSKEKKTRSWNCSKKYQGILKWKIWMTVTTQSKTTPTKRSPIGFILLDQNLIIFNLFFGTFPIKHFQKIRSVWYWSEEKFRIRVWAFRFLSFFLASSFKVFLPVRSWICWCSYSHRWSQIWSQLILIIGFFISKLEAIRFLFVVLGLLFRSSSFFLSISPILSLFFLSFERARLCRLLNFKSYLPLTHFHWCSLLVLARFRWDLCVVSYFNRKAFCFLLLQCHKIL